MPEKQAKQNDTILIADDNPNNLRVLSDMLEQEGYRVRFATNGVQALKSVNIDPPDIILLDIHMPNMDGYETCVNLKKDEKTKDIPVLFISAMTETANIVKAFQVGGMDYIAKPFRVEEVKARVNVHLALKKARDKLKHYNQLLIENDKLRNDVQRITWHDIKSPLNGIINFPVLVKMIGGLSEKQEEYLDSIVHLGHKMLNMINLSTDLYKMENGIYKLEPKRVDLYQVLNEVVTELQSLFQQKSLVYSIETGGEKTCVILGEHLLSYSMFANIIKNAVEASPEDESIIIRIAKNSKVYHVDIENKGCVPKDMRDTFFNKYSTSGKSRGTGLGTYSALMFAQTQGGRIEMQTNDAQNATTITIILPKAL